MLKRFGVSAIVLFVVFAAAQEPPAAPDAYAGHLAQQLYSNDYFGMSLQVPKDWATDLDPLPPNANAKLVAAYDQARQDEVQKGTAFYAYKKGARYGAQAMGFCGAAACLSDKPTDLTTSLQDNEIPDSLAVRAIPLSGRDPLDIRQRRIEAMRKGTVEFKAADEPLVLGRVAFVRVDLQLRGAGYSKYITTLLALRNDYLLEIDFASNDRKRLAALVQSVTSTLNFQPTTAR